MSDVLNRVGNICDTIVTFWSGTFVIQILIQIQALRHKYSYIYSFDYSPKQTNVIHIGLPPLVSAIFVIQIQVHIQTQIRIQIQIQIGIQSNTDKWQTRPGLPVFVSATFVSQL